MAQETLSVSVRPIETSSERRVYDRIEWIVELNRQYPNPFDPDEIAIDATFTSPKGTRLILPAFWYQDHRREADERDRERLVPQSPGQWRLRFCAPEPGQWQLLVTAKDQHDTAQSTPISFNIAGAKQRGFVRRASDNGRYFQFDSGEPYFMVGMNLGWAGRSGLRDYERWLARMGHAAANFARLWMTSPGRPMETKAAGLGRYDLGACWFYDQIFELASQHGVYCMLAFGTYGELIDGGHFGEGQWSRNPYNAANGGPATQPADFFTHAQARKHYQRRLRYLIGRYSAFTSLAFWEFWNEQDNARIAVPPEWVSEMAHYLKQHDPYKHLVTTSYAGMGQAEVWKMDNIDLTQRHLYGDNDSLFDAVPTIVNNTRIHDGYRKPHLLGEYGISWRGPDHEFDPHGVGTNFHNALWAATLSGAAGGACHWWWDSYIDPKNLYSHFAALARFSNTIDWPRRKFEPLKVLSPTWTKLEPETFVDVVLPVDSRWGRSDGRVRVVEVDGSIPAAIPGFLFGPVKPDLHTRTQIKVTLTQPSRMIVRALKVCNYAMVRVLVDDKPVTDWAFSALPGAAGQEKTEFVKDHNVYQAIFNKDYSAEIPAGEHIIALDCIAGDWMSIGSVTFTNARSSRYTGLRPYVLADQESGETLLWLQDPDSHVGLDRAPATPRAFDQALIELPVPKTGSHRIEWWDTRKGQIVHTETLSPEAGRLRLSIPSFSRDIALRVHRIPD